MTRLLVFLLALMLATPAAQAEKIKFYEDPVFDALNPDDPHPMEDLFKLAEDKDVRAQFILGDLYAKGKGGLRKDSKKAQHWFEESARAGYTPSFIRLAALAKRAGDTKEAYKWYTLANDFGHGKDARYATKARDALLKDKPLKDEDLEAAKKSITDWKKERSKKLADEAEAKKIAERRAAQEKRDQAEKAEAKEEQVKEEQAKEETKEEVKKEDAEKAPAKEEEIKKEDTKDKPEEKSTPKEQEKALNE